MKTLKNLVLFGVLSLFCACDGITPDINPSEGNIKVIFDDSSNFTNTLKNALSHKTDIMFIMGGTQRLTADPEIKSLYCDNETQWVLTTGKLYSEEVGSVRVMQSLSNLALPKAIYEKVRENASEGKYTVLTVNSVVCTRTHLRVVQLSKTRLIDTPLF